MNSSSKTIVLGVLALLAACSDDPPPRSTVEFVNNPILLEATMVTCARDRSRSRHTAECQNARDAVNRIASAAETERQQQLDQQSERKRKALRQTQLAAAEARRRATEQQRLREEAAYLQHFVATETDGTISVAVPAATGTAPGDSQSVELEGNQPGVVILPVEQKSAESVEMNRPVENVPSDLDAIRQELKQRQEPSLDN